MRMPQFRPAAMTCLACAGLALFSAGDQAKNEQSPKEAVQVLIEAIKAGDESAVLAAYAPIGDKKQADSVRFFADLLVAPRQLHQAMKARFGDKAKGSGVWKVGQELDDYLNRATRRAAKADVTVTGDTAVVKLPDRDEDWELLNPLERDIALRKDQGRWKIDLPKTLGVEKLTDLTSHAMPVEMNKRLPVLKKFAKAIAAGKYKDFDAFLEQIEAWHDNEIEDPFKE